MAWGKPAPEGDKPSWLMRIEKNDATLTSVHVLRVRPFDENLQIDTAKALEGNEHVREFYASGHRVTSRAARAWAECFAINSSIASLCIGDESFGDAGEEGCALDEALKGLAHSAAIEKIDLEYKGVRDESGNAIGKVLEQSGSVRELRLGRNENFGAVGYEAVFAGAKSGATLETLDLTDNTLDSNAARALGNFLKDSSSIKRLGLTRCSVEAEGLREIGAGLAQTKASLERLEMSGVKLGDGGAESCFGGSGFGTGSTTNFLEFDFVQCEIKEARDVEALDGLLRASPKFVNVNLRGNAFGDSGLATLANGAFASRAPESIDLGSCGLTGASAGSLRFALNGSSAVSLFDNAFGDDGVGKIFDSARGCPVTLLDLGAVGLTVEGLRAIVQALENAETFPNLQTLVIGGNPGAQDDDWEGLVNKLRAVRPSLDVAWRAADGGDDSKLQRDDTGRIIGVEK
jgi:hypothetical protein